MKGEPRTLLHDAGVRPSAQRVAVADYVLRTDAHPSADEVWAQVRSRFPMISRATVYNTLHLFVKKGLLRSFELGGGRVIFDPHVEDHHHFIDENDGRIYDISWAALSVSRIDELEDFSVREYQVVLRGRRLSTEDKEKEP
jgi:Fe2+ or Zn2+ uptake regulation protein